MRRRSPDPKASSSSALTTALERALSEGGAHLAADLLTNRTVLLFGLFGLDWLLLETGGIPSGRIGEIVGEEGSGKSTLCASALASAQR